MFKKNLLFLGVFFAAVSLVEAPRRLDPFFDASLSEPAGAPLCVDDEKSWQNLADHSRKLIELKTFRHIGNADPRFAGFLDAFVQVDEVARLLATRPEIVYRGRPVGRLSPEEAATIHRWLTEFKEVVEGERFNGQLLTQFSKENLPITIEIKFPSAPSLRPQGYVVKLLCRNGWRLGFYDIAKKDCNAWGCHAVSPFPFPLQMISCLFYEDWMRLLNESFVRVARNYLFPLPGTEGLPLDDWDVLVIQEDFKVPDNQGWQMAMAMKQEGICDFPDFLRKARGFEFNETEHCFLRKEGTQLVVRNVQRPAMGGNPAFVFLTDGWQHSLIAHMNGGSGVSSFASWAIETMANDFQLKCFHSLEEYGYSDDESGAKAVSASRRV